MSLTVNGYSLNFFGAYCQKINGNSKQYQATYKILGTAWPQYPPSQLDFLFGNKDLIMRNRMKLYDASGDFINSHGIAGMDVHGRNPSEWHQIIDIPERSRQEMFDNVKREFLEENGIANGDTTKRTGVAVNYQKSVPKQDRLRGS